MNSETEVARATTRAQCRFRVCVVGCNEFRSLEVRVLVTASNIISCSALLLRIAYRKRSPKLALRNDVSSCSANYAIIALVSSYACTTEKRCSLSLSIYIYRYVMLQVIARAREREREGGCVVSIFQQTPYSLRFDTQTPQGCRAQLNKNTSLQQGLGGLGFSDFCGLKAAAIEKASS